MAWSRREGEYGGPEVQPFICPPKYFLSPYKYFFSPPKLFSPGTQSFLIPHKYGPGVLTLVSPVLSGGAPPMGDFGNGAILIQLFTRWHHQGVLEDIEIYRRILKNYIDNQK